MYLVVVYIVVYSTALLHCSLLTYPERMHLPKRSSTSPALPSPAYPALSDSKLHSTVVYVNCKPLAACRTELLCSTPLYSNPPYMQHSSIFIYIYIYTIPTRSNPDDYFPFCLLDWLTDLLDRLLPCVLACLLDWFSTDCHSGTLPTSPLLLHTTLPTVPTDRPHIYRVYPHTYIYIIEYSIYNI